MKLRIMRSAEHMWYANRIGEIFEAEPSPNYPGYFAVLYEGVHGKLLINVLDCEVIKECGPQRTIGSYERLGIEIGALVDTKQAQYGEALTKVGDVLAIMYPDGIKPEQYVGMGLTVRVLDKLFRVANGDQGEESAWSDVAGYGLLGAMLQKGNE